MPPLRSVIGSIHSRNGPRLQTPNPTVICAHFLRQIEANHIRTPTQAPIPLEFDSATQSLSEWAWPCDPETDERVTPSELEAFRRTHRFKAPCCLCAFLDGSTYSESRIAVVETVTSQEDRNHSILNGEYVAYCARQRCGYFVCLERFYPLQHLQVRICLRRKHSLQIQELATIHDLDKSLRAGDGLWQLMTDVVVRGAGRRLDKINPEVCAKTKDTLMNDIMEGMPEARFWATFAQCLACKVVTLRKHFALSHVCGGKPGGRVRPYSPLERQASGPHVHDPLDDDLPAFPSSPTPTEIAEHGVFVEVDYPNIEDSEANAPSAIDETRVQGGETRDGSDDGSDGVPSLLTDDDFELPTLEEIFAAVPRRVIVNDA